MAVCVETLKQYPQDDLRTPVFIYERLCSIIYPEENDVGEFFLTLEKDPQQEDFLQVNRILLADAKCIFMSKGISFGMNFFVVKLNDTSNSEVLPYGCIS